MIGQFQTVIAIAALLATSISTAEIAVPRLKGAVMDLADMLSDPVQKKLAQSLETLTEEGGTKIVILTIPSLDGELASDYSSRVLDDWQLGLEPGKRGVLLLLARDDRRVSIEVDSDLRGEFSEAVRDRIIVEQIRPWFQKGDIEGGIVAATRTILQTTDPQFVLDEGLIGRFERQSDYKEGDHPLVVVGLILVLALIRIQRQRQRRLRYLQESGYWGGSFDAGFSGGGGGFNGDGASADW
ncbi:TPM domain-containing protein [Pseudobacteriovorax antillogorgiicola]|uniref:TPM domain-containing protein n=1 Tax=Pseudobacteriovorax antillogorgiicola TaxID=1513793 RepID=A0A1Y6BV97_9BACT|nr:TPM domain-containing protein [Pseudobacteriovorax antillogorgiicola]TCS52294.1 uncharacterized protein EDD56_10938 [Pseudobacteriovorax antillogorgiicola]SMF30503.1 uncharacterized protein SAMN06296036_109175 [Pseudobacteriovorax antillogorgiicola]